MLIVAQPWSSLCFAQRQRQHLATLCLHANVWIANRCQHKTTFAVHLDVLQKTSALQQANAVAENLNDIAIVADISNLYRLLCVAESGVFNFVDFFPGLKNL